LEVSTRLVFVKAPIALLHLPFLLALGSCKRLPEKMEITGARTVSSRAPSAAPIMSSAARFADDEQGDTASPPQKSPLTWTTPEGWREAAPDPSSAGMRLINLKFGPDGEGECYLSAMPGAAGGVKANVDRWRAQMGLPPLTDAEVEALPKRPFLNREASYVKLDGDFKPVGAETPLKGYRLIGLLQAAPEFTLFVKLTGPKALVEQNEQAFAKFIESIGIER
jgi:hypothetical protein